MKNIGVQRKCYADIIVLSSYFGFFSVVCNDVSSCFSSSSQYRNSNEACILILRTFRGVTQPSSAPESELRNMTYVWLENIVNKRRKVNLNHKRHVLD